MKSNAGTRIRVGKLVSQRQDKGDFDWPPGCRPRRTAHAVLLAVVVFVVLEPLTPGLPVPAAGPAVAAVSASRMALTTAAAGAAGNAATPPAVPAGSVPVVADPAGILSFERVEVETIAADGTRERTVASRGLARPSAGTLLAPLEVLKPSSPFGPPNQSTQRRCRGISLWAGLCGKVRDPCLLIRRRRGAGSRMACVGRR